jgi:hypothetical protein
LFRILEPSMYGGRQLRMGYDGEASEFPGDVVPDLDPIPEEVVGKAEVLRALQYCRQEGLTTLTDIIKLTTRGHTPHWVKTLTKAKQTPYVHQKYRHHLQHLLAAGVLSRSRAERLSYISSYFAVLKTIDWCRSIFNGKRLSEQCPPPPPVNLMTGVDIARAVQRHISRHGRLVVVECDLRHWFHQIKVDPELSRIFGLRDNEEYWEWTTLPMGWSWSPAIAQALAWSLLAYKEAPDMKDVFDTEAFKTRSGILPRWVDIHPGVGGGLGFVYYDNLVVLCDDQNTADVVVARITQNSKALKMAIKDKKDAQGNAVYGLKAWSHKEIAEQGVEFLGLHFQLQRKYGKNRYGSFTVRPAKTREWAALAVPANEATCRELASFVGKMVFTAMLPDGHLHGSPLGRATLRLAREIGAKAQKLGWDAVIPVPPETHTAWDMVKDRLVAPCEVMIQRTGEEGRLQVTSVIATDASIKGWGIIFYANGTGGRGRIREFHGKWSEKHTRDGVAIHASRLIFQYELSAALRALRYWKEAFPGQKVRMLIDNMGVVWALRNGYTRSACGQRMLDEAGEDLLGLIEEVIPLASEDNAADALSRGIDGP